ncbi:alkaline phosphatase D family protein [Paucibacter sp. Y2R2-4]|uniref:alkaline phosphatase D family protein n=1 Tax=Paucibacter sp. Y2R2-4 TaxID=2893553 RepID=UPI0021E49537|nr:alkaline phosphatase D family protein [Paucibacter sp. Y2R2-4]MCV2350350.1 alkaline phosphatase D family protein [Paucibacter sp. Y2R2-4]
MDRRSFLRKSVIQTGALITASSALTGLSGCMSNDNGSGIEPLPPTFPGSSTALPDTPPASGVFKFPQSVASGDPKSDGALLWARVVPNSADDVVTAAADANFQVKLRISSADNAALLGSNTALGGNIDSEVDVPVYAFYDNTVRHKISGLKPATVYYYQFTAGDSRSKVGRFKTAPAVDADIDKLKFAFMTCQDWSVNHWAGMSSLAREDLDFIVHLGDYIYEAVGASYQAGAVEAAHGALVLPNGVALPSGGKYANTLVDYRYLYKRYRSDPRLQALHERFAFVAIWDDHEFSDDCWQDRETYDNGSYNAATGGDNVAQPSRRRSASQAWFEFMPAEVSFTLDAASGINNIRIYRDLKFGKLMHLVMTDERLYRADHLIPEAAPNPSTGQPLGEIGARYMVPEASLAAVEKQKIDVAASFGLADKLTMVSMLGTSQRAWWKDTMKASTALWKIWGNETSLLKMSVNGAALPTAPADLKTRFILNADQWDGYNGERKDLMAHLSSNKISNVVAITGDLHAFFAGEVMDDYAAATPTPVMVDLVTSGISSNSFFSYFVGASANPAFAPVKPLVVINEVAAEGIAIQMLSAAVAMAAGVTDLSNTAAVQAAVMGAIGAGKIPAAAVSATPGLSTAPINTFDETLMGNMGNTIAATNAALAGASKSVPAMTLYGLIAQNLATALGIPVAFVPAAEVVKRMNPFANPTTGVPPAINNPWIRHADSNAQGYAVVSLSKTELVCDFNKIAPLSAGVAPTTPIASVKRVRVPVGKAQVTLG